MRADAADKRFAGLQIHDSRRRSRGNVEIPEGISKDQRDKAGRQGGDQPQADPEDGGYRGGVVP